MISEFSGVAASTDLLFGGHRGSKFITVPAMARDALAAHHPGIIQTGRTALPGANDSFPRVLRFGVALQAELAWGAWGRGLIPGLNGNGAFLVMVVALVGTTITPYMQVYIQSAVAEKGVTSREYRYERFEVIVGSLFAILTAGAIMLCMAATLWASGHGGAITSAAQAAQGLKPFAGQFASTLFAAGLFGASMLAGAILPLSTSYAVGEAFGFETGSRESNQRSAGLLWNLRRPADLRRRRRARFPAYR